MLSWSFVAILAAAPPTGFTLSIDRIPVSQATPGIVLSVDPLLAQVVLRGGSITGKLPRLCPTAERKGTVTTLKCISRRLWATLARDAKGAYIDLRQLTGVSWLDDASRVPMVAWPLRTLLLPDVCPGKLPAARGECALAQRDFKTAKAAWIEGIAGPDASLCHLRLGDLAMIDNNVEQALYHYSKITSVTSVGRMGQVRQCELMGTCLEPAESERMGDIELIPLELAREVRLYKARRELTAGRDAEAMASFRDSLDADGALCEGALSFCQKMIEAGLASDDVEARIAALSAFLTDKVRKGPLEYALNEAAARSALELGAPGFAASILSANSPHVPKNELGPHLLEIIKLYMAAGDAVRASVVLEYAESRLGATAQSGAWLTARRQLNSREKKNSPVASAVDRSAENLEALEALSTQVSLATDLARAAAVRSRAVAPVAPTGSNLENAP